jgi:hypothetical protein
MISPIVKPRMHNKNEVGNSKNIPYRLVLEYGIREGYDIAVIGDGATRSLFLFEEQHTPSVKQHGHATQGDHDADEKDD